MLTVLGWISLVVVVIATFGGIGWGSSKGWSKVATASLNLCILVCIAWTLFD